MAFDVVTFVIDTILVINILLGIGNWFGSEFNEAGYLEIENQFPNVSIDESEFENVTGYIETNPTVAGIGTALSNVKNVLLGIPTVTANALEIAQAPDDLVGIIEASLTGLVLFAYFIFALQVISYLRG